MAIVCRTDCSFTPEIAIGTQFVAPSAYGHHPQKCRMERAKQQQTWTENSPSGFIRKSITLVRGEGERRRRGSEGRKESVGENEQVKTQEFGSPGRI